MTNALLDYMDAGLKMSETGLCISSFILLNTNQTFFIKDSTIVFFFFFHSLWIFVDTYKLLVVAGVCVSVGMTL